MLQGLSGLRVVSFESRRSREMAELIRNYGGALSVDLMTAGSGTLCPFACTAAETTTLGRTTTSVARPGRAVARPARATAYVPP
jgi:hypothetical protein